jgi:hypothetical protein
MYVIVFKDINETKNRHQYSSQVVISRMILKNKHYHGNIFDEV